MTVLWHSTPGEKVWKLGTKHIDFSVDGCDWQEIDYTWKDNGNHLGHARSCDHSEKITVRGDDCTEIAQRIVDFLNADPATLQLLLARMPKGFVYPGQEPVAEDKLL